MMLFLLQDGGYPAAIKDLVNAALKGDAELEKEFEKVKNLEAYKSWRTVWAKRVDACKDLALNGNYNL